MKCPKCKTKKLSGKASVSIDCSYRDRLFLECCKPELLGLKMSCDKCGHMWVPRRSSVAGVKNENL
jgi:hypothetical protein